ncbi:FAD-dependent monooxygenase [Actinomadura sp. WMMB 499]|uniref:FAD-dependent monooxygenase n=1 Tax=Actinomadura sp. WMMB 499 TaxID=1219491 RepID=UPI00159E6B27|nr:FAD-dependent monooxygenase [Actinomadura sp. WMMB 499]
MTPRPGGGTNWFVTVPERRFADPAGALAAARERFAAHPAPVRRVLAAADPGLTLVNDLWAARWPGRLVRGRAVLVGDAAHAMSPSLGRGAGEALVDAVVLGTALRDLPVPAALRRYERGRLLPAQGIRWASAAALRVATTRRERVRDRMLSLAPG